MANQENPEPEVLHVQGHLTPLQDWNNDRRRGGVPQLATGAVALVEADRFKGHDRAARFLREQQQEFCEHFVPERDATYRIGRPRRVYICICRPGEHS